MKVPSFSKAVLSNKLRCRRPYFKLSEDADDLGRTES